MNKDFRRFLAGGVVAAVMILCMGQSLDVQNPAAQGLVRITPYTSFFMQQFLTNANSEQAFSMLIGGETEGSIVINGAQNVMLTNSIFTNSTFSGTFYGNGAGLFLDGTTITNGPIPILAINPVTLTNFESAPVVISNAAQSSFPYWVVATPAQNDTLSWYHQTVGPQDLWSVKDTNSDTFSFDAAGGTAYLTVKTNLVVNPGVAGSNTLLGTTFANVVGSASGTFTGNATGLTNVQNSEAGLGYVLITTNGYSQLNSFVSDTANPFQDAMNYWTNFVGGATAQQLNWGSGMTVTTNSAGGKFVIGATLYNPSGWRVPNSFIRQGWRITGDGIMNSALVADSNVIVMLTNGYAGPNNTATMPSLEIDHLTLVDSNETMKGAAIINSGGAAQKLNIHDNALLPYSCWSAVGYSGGGAGGGLLQTTPSFPPGVIGILLDSNDGAPSSVHDNIFDGTAAGIVAVSGHCTSYGNQYASVGLWSGSTSTNNYPTNDAATYFPPYNVPGTDLALGPCILGEITGGDISIHDEYMYAGNTGFMFTGATAFYGELKLEKDDDEAMQRDIVVAPGVENSTVGFPTLRVDDCYNAQHAALVTYQLNETTHVLTLSSGLQTGAHSMNNVFETTLEPSSLSSSNSMLTWRIDNVPVFIMDPSAGTIWATNLMPYSGSGSGLTNVSAYGIVAQPSALTLTQVSPAITTIGFQGQSSSGCNIVWTNSASVIGIYTNQFMVGGIQNPAGVTNALMVTFSGFGTNSYTSSGTLSRYSYYNASSNSFVIEVTGTAPTSSTTYGATFFWFW
jgi:hypothetical protein